MSLMRIFRFQFQVNIFPGKLSLKHFRRIFSESQDFVLLMVFVKKCQVSEIKFSKVSVCTVVVLMRDRVRTCHNH